MSKDIVVLTPNGRRQTIRCTADTSILQVLEDACHKQGFQPSDYDLKHHNHILDLTTTIRYSNLPNKATVEMVEADKKRQELNVTVGLLLEDGERRTADFSPHTSLYDLITSLAATELNSLQNPSILYMRQEITGLHALQEKTLRMLGLIKGRAILRLLNKAEEARQANVSAVYRVPLPESTVNKVGEMPHFPDTNAAGPSHITFNTLSSIKNEKMPPIAKDIADQEPEQDNVSQDLKTIEKVGEITMPVAESNQHNLKSDSSNTSMSRENLERRLNIEEEVTFLGAQKAIAFERPEEIQDELDDLPDEFYELSIEEVRKLYHDLQQQRIVLENTPLLTSDQRDLEKQTMEQKVNVYKNVVVRIQFPDSIILQGIFQPTNTIEDVVNFVKEHLKKPDKEFKIFTTPLKETLDPKTTLLEAKFVPCVHMHFKWLEGDLEQTYLKEEIYMKKTSSDAASILASKYRAPSRRKLETGETSRTQSLPSTSKNSKMPKWFKN